MFYIVMCQKLKSPIFQAKNNVRLKNILAFTTPSQMMKTLAEKVFGLSALQQLLEVQDGMLSISKMPLQLSETMERLENFSSQHDLVKHTTVVSFF